MPHPRKVGILTFGTELVTGADGTIAALLGASPGDSTAPAIMHELLERCFPQQTSRWQSVLRTMFPDAGDQVS
ncbi:malate:quinone oxidoreductase [Nocardia carnea]|uniref:malate:quinone oxidoreductase n=1 Tax=Nocardia carnea TaxID=37328 RepID=UPI003D777E44